MLKVVKGLGVVIKHKKRGLSPLKLIYLVGFGTGSFLEKLHSRGSFT